MTAMNENIIHHITMLLLLLSRFSRVWLCATPEMAAHQPPLFLGFSRQEHWSGLPFPSPTHESEKWKWKVKVKAKSESEVAQSCQTQRPHGLQPTRLLYATMYLVSKKCLWLGSYHRLCSNVLFWEDLAQDTCFSSSKWRLSSIALFGCSALFFKTIFFNKSEGFICTR